MVDGDEGQVMLGCLGPGSLLVLAKAGLLAMFFYGLLSLLGVWGD